MTEKLINIETYFKENTVFKIPSYQRGYKWSVEEKGQSSVEFFCDSLIKAFEPNQVELNKKKKYFIEAVTVVKGNEPNSFILVDGQQRTITLFLLFIALKDYCNPFLQRFELKYEVRDDSNKYLENLSGKASHMIDDIDTQDIFLFKRAIQQIENKIKALKGYEKDFIRFLKKDVLLLFNTIDENKALNTFIALNGLKAIMQDEELVKSSLLIELSKINHLASEKNLDKKEQIDFQCKINEERGILARNWDKWLYWWNQDEVRDYFGLQNQHPLYYLLITYWNLESESEKDFSFYKFRNAFIQDSNVAKHTFEGLRKLQKTFEDLYSSYATFNFLGIILKTSNGNDKQDAIEYVLNHKGDYKSIHDYAKWSLVKATHRQIITELEETDDKNSSKVKMAINAIELINEKYVYSDENEIRYNDDRVEYAYRFLMLLNILEDNKLERKFDFSIWGNRSLEHIYPKSKAGDLDFSPPEFQEGSVHCIGNLVLLYKDNNSEFSNKYPEGKKTEFFKTGNINIIKSRNLLHTLSVFANSKWTAKEIIDNKKKTILDLKLFYGI